MSSVVWCAAQWLTCCPGCVSVRVQSCQVKRQGASTDEISRIMEGVRVTPWERDRGGVDTDRLNEGYLKARLETSLLLKCVEKRTRMEFAEVTTEVFSPLWASCKKTKGRKAAVENRGRERKERIRARGESRVKRGEQRYVSPYCRWQVAWSLEPACLSETSAQVCVCVCTCG